MYKNGTRINLKYFAIFKKQKKRGNLIFFHFSFTSNNVERIKKIYYIIKHIVLNYRDLQLVTCAVITQSLLSSSTMKQSSSSSIAAALFCFNDEDAPELEETAVSCSTMLMSSSLSDTLFTSILRFFFGVSSIGAKSVGFRFFAEPGSDFSGDISMLF